MRAIIVLFVSACLANLCLAQETTTKRCIMYKCDSNLYKPVCGKQFKNGCWEERIFQNDCYMLSANGCSDGFASLSMSQETTTTQQPCIMYLCIDTYDPVCGKQKVNGCWEERIFQNSCYMKSANSCGKANYVPCVDNKCPKPTTTIN